MISLRVYENSTALAVVAIRLDCQVTFVRKKEANSIDSSGELLHIARERTYVPYELVVLKAERRVEPL